MNELALWEGLTDAGEMGDENADEVWREQPIGLDEFVQSKDHLGLPALFPAQREAIMTLLGDDPKRIFEEGRQYQMAVLLWGKGSGKDYICSVLVCYLVYVLLCLRDPQAYFEFGPGEPIDVLNVAYSADQAKYVFFTKLTERIKGWVWLREHFNVFESGRRLGVHKPGLASVELNADHILFPRKIRCFSRHAANESYEGMNIIAWIMDEASAFLSKLKRENANAIFGTLRSSANTRFPGRWIGAVISYPRHADDFTMTKLREALANPEGNTYADGPKKTWEVNTRVAHDEMVEIRPGHVVPVTFVNDYRDDYEDSLAKYECQPPNAREAFFRFPERLDQAVQRGRQPLIDWEEIVTYKTVELEDGDGRPIEVQRRYSAVKLTRLGKLPKGSKVYFHGDPGLVNDSFTIALAHGAPATIMAKMPAREVMDERELLAKGIDPDSMVDWERDVVKVIVDAVIVWKPDPQYSQQVDMDNVLEILLQLHKQYRIGFRAKEPTGTLDHWNSAGIVQALLGKRMNVAIEHWSRDFQVDVYRNARSCFYNDLVVLPDTPSVTSTNRSNAGAIAELKRIEFVDGQKIDHPADGGKDIADAVCRVICHVTWAARTGFNYGMAFGHASQYPHLAPAVHAPGKIVDPKGVPKMATDTRLEIERQNRAAAPLGELVPSAGSVNGRRFTSVRAK